MKTNRKFYTSLVVLMGVGFSAPAFAQTVVDGTANVGTGDTALTQNVTTGGNGGAYVAKSPSGQISVDNDVEFSGNTTTGGGDGGAIYIENGGTVGLAGGNKFENNTAAGQGGAIYIDNGGTLNIATEDGRSIDFNNNTAAGLGGANDLAGTGNVAITGDGDLNLNGGISGALNVANDGGNVVLGDVTDFNGSYSQVKGNTVFTGDVNDDLGLSLAGNTEFQGSLGISGGTPTTCAGAGAGSVCNNGALTLSGSGSSVNRSISGTGTTVITGDIKNNSQIAQDVNIDAGAKLTTDASGISGGAAQYATVTNDGTLDFNGGTNENTIVGSGELIISGNVTNADGASVTQDEINIDTTGKLTSSAGDLHAANGITNDGKLEFVTGVGSNNTNSNAISGTGDLIVSGNITNGTTGTIVQDDINISGSLTNNNNNAGAIVGDISVENGGTLTTGAGSISDTDGTIDNAGNIIFNGGTNANNISGSGKLTIDGNVTNSNGTNISQDEIIVGAGDTFTTNASDLDTTGGISNGGNLNFNGGTNNNNVNGGSVIISGDVVNADGSELDLNNITINNGAGLTINADDIDTSAAVNEFVNNGSLTFTGGTNDDTITGTGGLTIAGDVSNSANVTQGTIGVNSDATLNNSGTITGNTTNDGTVNNSGSFTGDITNNSNWTNSVGGTIHGNITNSGVMDSAINALYDTDASIVNDGTMNLSGGTSNASRAINSNDFTGNGDLNLSGFITNGKTITGDNVNIIGDLLNTGTINADVNNSGTLTTNASNINGDINNSGNMNFNGGTNSNTITGTGDLNITGNVTNNGSIAQDTVNVGVSGNMNNASDITADINNTGTVNNTGNIVGDINNSGSLSSNASSITGDITNNANANLNLTDGTNSNNITNNGTTSLDSVNNAGTISGTGDLIVDGNSSNSGNISQGTITVDGSMSNTGTITGDISVSNGGSLTSNADNLTDANGINNAGELNLAGGTNANDITNTGDLNWDSVVNNGTITGTGNLTVDGTSTNAGDVTQGTITIDGDLSNTGSMAGNISVSNGGTLSTDASAITDTDGTLSNDGTLNLLGGVNANNIDGNGTTNVDGTFSNAKNITQDNININAGADATNTGNINGAVSNNGTMGNSGTVTGDVTNTSDWTNTGGGKIVGDMNNSGTFNSDVLGLDGNLTNSGTANISGTGALTNVVNTGDLNLGMTGNIGGIISIDQSGNVNVENGANINVTGNIFQDALNIASGGKLTGNASDMNLKTGIDNDGNLVFNGGTNTNTITGDGKLTIDGNVINSATVTQDTVAINNGKKLTNDGAINASVNNNGTMDNTGTVTGGVSNVGTWDNKDTGRIVGDVTNVGNMSSNASNIIGDINNTGDLTFTGGTNSNTITGNGDTIISGNVTNTGNITQSDVNVDLGGVLANAAGGIINANMDNDGTVNNAGAVNGNVRNDGTWTNAGVGAITGNVDNNGTFTSRADKVTGTIDNSGTLNLNGGTNSAGRVTNTSDVTGDGTGTVNLGGFVNNSKNITGQDNVNISTAADVVNSGNITANNIGNNGKMDNSGTVTGTVNNNSGANWTNNGAGNIVGNVNNAGTMTSDASKIAGDINNSGTLNFTGGDNTNDIYGHGTLNIVGNGSNSGNLLQDTMNIANGAGYTNNATGNILADIVNNGTFDNIGHIIGDINNAGTFNSNASNIIGNIANNTNSNLNLTGGVNENTITNAGNVKLDDVNNAGTITGAGNLVVDGASQNSGTINQGKVTVDGDISNTGTITGDIFVSAGGSLTSNASGLTDPSGITNAGDLNLVGGTNTNSITNTGSLTWDGITNSGMISGTGDLIVKNGTSTNTSIVNQGTITIESGALNNNGSLRGDISINSDGTLKTNATNIVDTDGTVSNDGTLEFLGGTNANNIDGNGNLVVSGNVTNNATSTIVQDEINVTGNFNNTNASDDAIVGKVNISDTGSMTSAANAIDGEIQNDGTLTFAGGANDNMIMGAGDLNLNGNGSNTAYVVQDTININGTWTNMGDLIATGGFNINSSGKLTTNATDIRGDVDNSGVLDLTGGVNNSAISGTGSLVISGDVESLNMISLDEISITGSLTTDIDLIDITSAGSIQNTGTLTLTGNGMDDNSDAKTDTNVNAITNDGKLVFGDGNLTNAGEISGTGNMTVHGNLANTASVTQDSITISRDGVLTTGANSLNIADVILNDGLLNFNVNGTLDENIAGAGDVMFSGGTTILSGTNNASHGNMVLNGGNVTVGNADNMTVGDIVFDTANSLRITDDATIVNGVSGTADATIITDSTVTITGVIRNDGDFIKDGNGKLVLDMGGGNTYANTIVNTGILAGTYNDFDASLNPTGVVGTINGSVSGMGSVEFMDAGNANIDFNKDINIGGTFYKTGDASFNVGNNSFRAKNVDITSGAIYANGLMDVTGGTVHVGTDGILGGTGTVKAGTLNIDGTMSAGNSIGTLNVNGNLNFKAGSKNLVEIAQSSSIPGGTAADSINLNKTGSVNIDSTSVLEIANVGGDQSHFFVAEEFNIIAAANSINNIFQSVSITGDHANRLETSQRIDKNGNLVLSVSRKSTNYNTEVNGLTHNQASVASGIDAISTGFGGGITDVLLALEAYHYGTDGTITQSDGRSLARAFDDMSGGVYANSFMIPYLNTHRDEIYDRISLKANGRGACPSCADNVWVAYTGGYNKIDSDTNNKPFTTTNHGVMFGYDRSSINSKKIAGVMAGMSSNKLEQDNNAGTYDTVEGTSYSLGVYGGYIGRDWDIRGMLNGGYYDNTAKRDIAFMIGHSAVPNGWNTEADFTLMNINLDVEGAFKAKISDHLNVRGFGGLRAGYTMHDAIDETGAHDELNLAIESGGNAYAEGRFGFGINGQYENWGWRGQLSVRHMFLDPYASFDASLKNYSTAKFADVQGTDLGKTYFNIGAGTDIKMSDSFTLNANLGLDLADTRTGVYGNVGFSYKF